MNTTPPPSARTCPACGTPLPHGVPPEQCPKCLLQAGLPTERDPAESGGLLQAADAPENAGSASAGGAAANSGGEKHWPRVGDQFGHYKIWRMLGKGGMGAVFEAEDLESSRRVALKVLGHALDSPAARQRFLREGRLAASINHPNSVYVFGTEEIGGTPVIAMELVPGGTLQERVARSGPLPVPQAVDAILQVIAGLEAARALGILHRDVKPSNCFEDADGTVKIGDFGLSISTEGADLNITAHGALLGTPAFSAPEQLRGQEFSVRSDLYAVGVTLFYLVTGRTPFEGRDMVQLIANVLEQPAPSPKKFRPDLPQELAKVILRCLAKHPGDRFDSYDQLRQALAPFSSAAPIPAPLGMRFSAGLVDMILAGLVGMAYSLVVIGSLLPLSTLPQPGLKVLILVVSAFATVILSYAILEGIWGASIGKMLFRLRVAGPDRNPPGVLKAGLRAGMFQILPALPYWAVFGFDPARYLSETGSLVQLGMTGLFYLILAGLFATARRRNGYASVHDLVTGTRVIRRMAFQGRPVLQPPEEAPPAPENLPITGPYHILGTLGSSPAGEWLLGYDTRLLRKVWLQVLPAGSAPVPAPLRNLGRAGRLRWLAGRRSPEENWDAYEGLSGQPLLERIRTPQPWSHVRHWLHDLAIELEAAERTATTPDVLNLERVWITLDGRAKLLDFPAPGLAHEVAAGTAIALEGAAPPEPAVNAITAPEAPPMTTETRSRATRFLWQMAASAVQGAHLPASAAETNRIPVPLPLHARDFLDRLPALPGPAAAAVNLRSLIHLPAVVSRRRRLGLAAACAVLPLLAGFAAFFGSRMMVQWDRQQPEVWELNQLLMIRSTQRMAPNRPMGNPTDEQIAVYIASHYRPLVTHSNQWMTYYALAMVQGANRKFAEQSVRDHPAPTGDQILQAEDAVEPILARMRQGNITGKAWFPLMVFAVSWIAYVAIPALFAALLFKGGVVLRAFRVAIVRRDGQPASRLRVFWRALVTWSPLLLGPIALPVVALAIGWAQAGVMLGALAALLATWSLLSREQSLQDRIARTCLVPR